MTATSTWAWVSLAKDCRSGSPGPTYYTFDFLLLAQEADNIPSSFLLFNNINQPAHAHLINLSYLLISIHQCYNHQIWVHSLQHQLPKISSISNISCTSKPVQHMPSLQLIWFRSDKDASAMVASPSKQAWGLFGLFSSLLTLVAIT